MRFTIPADPDQADALAGELGELATATSGGGRLSSIRGCMSATARGGPQKRSLVTI